MIRRDGDTMGDDDADGEKVSVREHDRPGMRGDDSFLLLLLLLHLSKMYLLMIHPVASRSAATCCFKNNRDAVKNCFYTVKTE